MLAKREAEYVDTIGDLFDSVLAVSAKINPRKSGRTGARCACTANSMCAYHAHIESTLLTACAALANAYEYATKAE